MVSFVNPQTERFDATLLADHIAHEPRSSGAISRGNLYEYREGVYVQDPYVVTRRCAKALGATYTKNVESQAAAHLLNIELTEVGLPELPPAATWTTSCWRTASTGGVRIASHRTTRCSAR